MERNIEHYRASAGLPNGFRRNFIGLHWRLGFIYFLRVAIDSKVEKFPWASDPLFETQLLKPIEPRGRELVGSNSIAYSRHSYIKKGGEALATNLVADIFCCSHIISDNPFKLDLQYPFDRIFNFCGLYAKTQYGY